MRPGEDCTQALQDQVRQALNAGAPLNICGGGSKTHLGRAAAGEVIEIAAHRGIVSYAPAELVLTARAGTPLREIEAVLAEHGQHLPFEPPHLGDNATLGGTIACGLSGPARFARGAARDYVLGVELINGAGEVVRFGGQVMKNVAGYDMSRLMVGAYGTLGLLLEISLKVLPLPECTQTRVKRMGSQQALALMAELGRQPLPLTGAVWEAGSLYLRFAGAEAAVTEAADHLGGEKLEADTAWWQDVREMSAHFFISERPLWRLSLPPASAPFAEAGETLIDWGGAQRWLKTQIEPEQVFAAATRAGGHATLYRDPRVSGQVQQPLSPELLALHQRIKQALDPQRVFNPGRLYAEI